MTSVFIPPRKKSPAFSLIELVIVLVLIAIIAAVAIPRFHSMTVNAEESSIRGTLGNVRSAISLWRSERYSRGIDAWPPYTATLGNVLDTEMPSNPWGTGTNAIRNATGETSGDRDVTVADGWSYNPDNGEFWANTSGNTENTW